MYSRIGTEGWRAWIPCLGLVAIALIYLAFPTRNYFFDGIDFAQTIEETPRLQPSLAHPNHLIYNVVGWIFYRLVLILGFQIRAVAALQILNAVLSTLTAYVLYLVLRTTLRSRYLAYCLTLLFAFSATWWKFSTDADAYIPSVLFLLISFFLALPNRKSSPLLIAFTYAISLCFHQIAIVFFPVLVVALLLQQTETVGRKRLIHAISFGAASLLITFAAYAGSFYLLTGTFQVTNFVRWSMSYAPDESFGFHALDNLGFTLRGHFRLFFGGRLNASRGLINPVIVILIVIAVILLLVLAITLLRHFRKPDLAWLRSIGNDPFRRTVALLCLVWVSVYLVFLFFLLAHHTYYRLFYLPALIVLVGLALDSYKSNVNSSRKYRLALFVAVLTLANFLMLIFPYSHVEKYPPLALALEMNQTWPKGTVIYFGLPNSDQSLVKYFSPGTTWKQLNPKTLDNLESELRDAESRDAQVWLETTAIDQLSANDTGREWLRNHAAADNARSLITRAHNIRFVQIVSGGKE